MHSRLPYRRSVGAPTSVNLSVAAVEQLDRHAFRRADEADAHARTDGGRLLGELDALGLEVGGDGIDATDREPEVIEPLIRRHRRGIDGVAGARPA